MKNNNTINYIKKENQWGEISLSSKGLENKIMSYIDMRKIQFSLIGKLIHYKRIVPWTCIILLLLILINLPIQSAPFQIISRTYEEITETQNKSQFFSYEEIISRLKKDSFRADFMAKHKFSFLDLLEKPENNTVLFYKNRNNRIILIKKHL